MQIYPNLILQALEKLTYPGDKQNIVAQGLVQDDIKIDGKKVSFSLRAKKQNDAFIKSVVKASEQAILLYVDENCDIKGNISVIYPEQQKKDAKKVFNAKNIIAICSGKGGVGKSTIAVNLAAALAQMGYQTGLLDADIFGPSIPKMFGMETYRPLSETVEGKHWIVPAEKYGIKMLSIGFFVEPQNAIVWRGAMASNAIRQLVEEGAWGELDYFIVDLPPGTSDIHLTIVNTLKFTGAVVVSTPQQVAIADAIKGIQMFENEKINVPVVGLIENMAYFSPVELPNNKYYIFGKEGVKKLAAEKNIPLLAQIPVIQSVCESGDEGKPMVFTQENTIVKNIFLNLAQKITKIQ